MSFSGSYLPDDVTFLLKPVQLAPTDVAEKERLIQSGQRHYSEMISAESVPSIRYLRVFHQAMQREKKRFASHVLTLATHLAQTRSRVTIVSLARAGTPIGVLLGRTLRKVLGREARHYSLSIIRDRGIDENALRYILAREPADSIAFVDGWTGKGVIARELRQAIARFNRAQSVNLDAGLYVVADLAGEAAFAACADDYLIPSSVLGATISGLVSRSILNDTVIGPDDFHGCLYYREFEDHDISRMFVDEVYAAVEQHLDATPTASVMDRARLRSTSEAFLAQMRERFGVRDPNHVKPGIGEATRVLLRRVPDCVLVRDPNADDVAHLLVLAREKDTPVIVDSALPYNAAAIIKEMEG